MSAPLIALKSVEWAGERQDFACCPSCHAPAVEDGPFRYKPGIHREDCAIAAAISAGDALEAAAVALARTVLHQTGLPRRVDLAMVLHAHAVLESVGECDKGECGEGRA